METLRLMWVQKHLAQLDAKKASQKDFVEAQGLHQWCRRAEVFEDYNDNSFRLDTVRTRLRKNLDFS